MLANTSSAELTQWIAYDAIEPIGAIRDDFHAALISRTVAAQYTKKPGRLEDFLISWKDDGEEDDRARAQRMKELVRGAAPGAKPRKAR